MGLDADDKRDTYYRLAKKNGYRARSAYKLIHIDDEYGVFDGTTGVVDLCAAPGSWSQHAARRIAAQGRTPKIVSVDVQDIAPIPGVTCLKDDITSDSCATSILEMFGGPNVDLVMCDGAPDITGLHDIDEYLQVELLVSALSVSLRIGKTGSSFIGKCFKARYTPYVVSHFRRFYKDVVLLKPKASRPTSIECFIYSTGMRVIDADPLVLDTDTCCEDVPMIPCGYGRDKHIEYEVHGPLQRH